MCPPRKSDAAALLTNGRTSQGRLAFALAVALAAWSLHGTSLAPSAGAATGRSFNGPEKSWQSIESTVPSRVVVHECIGGGARDDAGCEHIGLLVPAGQSAQLACAVQPVAVLEELATRIWVKANRPGVQLAVRIALPRSVGVRTHAAVTTIVRGEQYDRVGRWQQLALADVPRKLAEQVRVLRTEPGASVDPREAYVDAVVLLVPGGPDATEVWTDDLDVEGVVLEERSGVQPVAFTASVATPSTTTIRLQGGTLQLDGRAFLPRVIEWRGEPLQFLADRGFNTIELAAQPTAEQASDARRAGLWFVCPPPKPDELTTVGIAPTCDRVLAWRLTDHTGGADSDYLRRWADFVRQRDPLVGRPILVVPESDWEDAGKAADIVVARHLLAARVSDVDYRRWMASRRPLAAPGTPLWVCLQTQFDSAVSEQCAALVGNAGLPLSVEDDRLELLVRIAVTERCCGYLFSSQSSLAEKDPVTRHRAAVLELINQRLQLIEPWLAGGKIVGRIQSSDADWSAALLHVDYARLLVPIPAAKSNLAGKAFVVPGVPESSQTFHLSPVALQSLPAHRVTGGMRAVWESGDDDLLLLTENPQVVTALRQRTAQNGARVVKLERELAAGHAAAIADTARRLTPFGVAGEGANQAVGVVNSQLRQVDALVAAGRILEAHRLAQSARDTLARVADAERRAVGLPTELASCALAISYETLVDHAQFTQRVISLRSGDNLLFGGDFEDVGQLTTVGWQHVSHPLPGVEAAAELSTKNPHHGRYCLELRATAAASDQSAGFVSSAPIWISSPPVPVEKGQIVEITGWVRVDEPITRSVDGVAIVDSLGGAELTLTVGQTSGWQPFQILRGASESTDLRLTFALTGLGTAQIDGVMIRTLDQPVARRLPPVETASSN